MRKINFKETSTKMKVLFDSEREGSEGFEGTLLTPLVFTTLIILLYFFFMCMSYISFSNLANSIAMEMNMRQTGYKSAVDYYSEHALPQILTYKNTKNNTDLANGSELLNREILPNSNITFSPDTNYLRAGAFSAIEKYKEQFTIPFNEVKSIEISSSAPINDSNLNRSMAGTIIKVTINFSTMTYGTGDHALANIKAVGWGIIS